jgi:Holliday junction resolvase RusA-like endonuclease
VTDRLHFVAPGSPVPLERSRVGRGRHYLPAKSAEYRERIRTAWMQAGGPCLGDAPLSCSAIFHIARFPTHYGTGRNAEKIRPKYADALPPGDTDNYLKAVLDALSRFAFADDTQVVCLAGVHKRWADGGGPRSAIELWIARPVVA